jgi:hypothetical protein
MSSDVSNVLSAAICFGVLLIVTNASEFDSLFESCSSSNDKYCPEKGCIDAFSECGTDGCLHEQRKCSNGTCITSLITCDGCTHGFVRCPYPPHDCTSNKKYCEDDSGHFFGTSWTYWVIVAVGVCVVGALVACRYYRIRMYRQRLQRNNVNSAAGFTTGVPMTPVSSAPGSGGGISNAAFAPPAYSVATTYPTPNNSYTPNDSNGAPKPYPVQPGYPVYPPTSNAQQQQQQQLPQGAQAYPPMSADSTVSGPVPPAYTEANLPPPPAYEEVTK